MATVSYIWKNLVFMRGREMPGFAHLWFRVHFFLCRKHLCVLLSTVVLVPRG